MLCLTFALLSNSLLAPPIVETYLIDPSDDVWVYPHASDPGKDMLMRVWGVDGKAAAEKGQSSDDYSYGYLRFNLGILPKKAKLIEAKLTLTQAPDPGYTLEMAKAAPLEARVLGADFDERTWDYGQVSKIAPDPKKDAIIGIGSPEKWEAGKPVSIIVDFLFPKSPFPDMYAKLVAQNHPFLNLALTSRMDPSEGRGVVYKVFSKEGPKEVRPVLKDRCRTPTVSISVRARVASR